MEIRENGVSGVGYMGIYIIGYLMRKLIVRTILLMVVLQQYSVAGEARVCPHSYFFDTQHC